MGGEEHDLNSIMKKKKILQGVPRDIIPPTQFSIRKDLLTGAAAGGGIKLASALPFSLMLNPSEIFRLTGTLMINANKFIDQPRGHITMTIMDYSEFRKNSNIQFKDLTIKASMLMGSNGERINYLVKENIGKNSIEAKLLTFETYYYDDVVRFDVYHKNSTIKANMIGKGSIELKNFGFEENIVIPVQIHSKKLN